jgi:large subunit ribosomal protein L23
MKAPQTIILRPLVTEKSTALTQDANVLTFEVARDANKIEIRRAVEVLFSVKVVGVRVAKTLGKIKKVGKSIGRSSDGKKAYVKLAAGEKLPPIFEGV